MTQTNNEKPQAPALADVLTKDEMILLWQLLNVQGAGAPFATAHIAAGFYAKAKLAAVSHGLVAP